MEGAYLLLGAVLALYGLWFHTSLTADLSSWFLLPARVLFATRPEPHNFSFLSGTTLRFLQVGKIPAFY